MFTDQTEKMNKTGILKTEQACHVENTPRTTFNFFFFFFFFFIKKKKNLFF